MFEFVIALVLISTAGKFLSGLSHRRQQPAGLSQGDQEQLERIRDTVEDLSGRLMRLEQERDFYKELLDSPGRREIPPPGREADASGDVRPD